MAEVGSVELEEIRCGRCKDDLVKAVLYCADCKKKFCNHHAEEHLYHVSDHELLPIEDSLKAERYEVERCKTHHKHVIDEICVHCKKLFCKRCNPKEICPDVNQGGNPHEIFPLKEVADEQREKLRNLSHNLEDKINRCRQMEKSTRRRLAYLEDWVERIYGDIDHIADDLIQRVKQETDELKKEFKAYVAQTTHDVNQFSEETLQNITVLDDLHTYGTYLADKRADKQLLEEYDDLSTNLNQANNNPDLEKSIILKTPYCHRGTAAPNIGASKEFVPSSMEFVKNEKTNSFCYGVSWTDDDRLLCTMDHGIEVRLESLQLDKTVNISNQDHTFSAALVGEKLYIRTFCGTKNEFCAWVGSLETGPTNQLIHNEKNPNPETRVIHLSANAKYLASIDCVHKTLKIYRSRNVEHLFDIQLTDMKQPYGVHLISDGVLVTDLFRKSLYKYTLSPSPALMWTCTGLHGPSEVRSDESGLIYVISGDRPTIYIVSPEGTVIKEVTHEKLEECLKAEGRFHDIAIQGGRMALACRGQGVMLFNIH